MLLLASLISLCLAQIITPGAKCPKIPLIADFDVPRVSFFDLKNWKKY